MSNSRAQIFKESTKKRSHVDADENLQRYSKRISEAYNADPSLNASVDGNQEMRQKFMAVRLKKYKPQSYFYQGYVYALIFVLALGCAGLINELSKINRTPKKIFCNTMGDDVDPGKCEPCPLDAECENGEIIRCNNDKILRNYECVLNEEMVLLKSKLAEYLENYLSYKKGEAECKGYDESHAALKIANIDDVLGHEFGKKPQYKNALEKLKKDLDNDYPKVGNLLVTEDFDPKGIEGFVKYVQSANSKYSLRCKLAILYKTYIVRIWLTIFVTVGLVILIIKKISEKKYVIIAENLYRSAILKMKQEGKLSTKHLLDEVDVKLSKSERELILRKLDHIRKIDEQATTLIEKGEKLWVLI